MLSISLSCILAVDKTDEIFFATFGTGMYLSSSLLTIPSNYQPSSVEQVVCIRTRIDDDGTINIMWLHARTNPFYFYRPRFSTFYFLTCAFSRIAENSVKHIHIEYIEESSELNVYISNIKVFCSMKRDNDNGNDRGENVLFARRGIRYKEFSY